MELFLAWILVTLPLQLIKTTEAINVYPNPVTDFIHLSITLKQQPGLQLHLVNLLWQIIRSMDAGNVAYYQNNISVANLPDGVYMLKLQTTNGIQSRKIAVTR